MNILTLVLGASENVERYSNKAINMLLNHQHTVYAVGARVGNVNSVPIFTSIHDALLNSNEHIDTVTLYLNPKRQDDFQNEIINLKPRRVIFNPGTENPSFYPKLMENGIEYIEACTLVLLATGQY